MCAHSGHIHYTIVLFPLACELIQGRECFLFCLLVFLESGTGPPCSSVQLIGSTETYRHLLGENTCLVLPEATLTLSVSTAQKAQWGISETLIPEKHSVNLHLLSTLP